jgi:hypothetical protein
MVAAAKSQKPKYGLQRPNCINIALSSTLSTRDRRADGFPLLKVTVIGE